MKILLMGATGKSATPAIKALQEKGLRPVAAVRDIPKAKKHLGEDLDFVYFDYTDPSTFASALEGVNRLFLIPPPGTKDPETVRKIMEIAREHGVELIVFQSGRTSSSVEGKPLNKIEAYIKGNSDLNCCLIRPALFMQNYNTWMGETLADNQICLPLGNTKASFIDVGDLGAAIATVLSTDGHVGKVYNLTTSAAIDQYEVASILSAATGREITYTDLSTDDYVQKMIDKGWTEYLANYVGWLFGRVKDGTEIAVSDDISKLLGREPRSFKDFAKDNFGKN